MLEIASDSTSKLDASTPKNSKKNSSFSVDSPTFCNIDDLRINRTQSFDENESHVDLTHNMINIDMSLPQPNIQNETVTLNNTFESIKRTSNNFMESFQPNLDIEFKMPTLPVSRKSAERNQNTVNEEFTSAVACEYLCLKKNINELIIFKVGC